MTYAHCNVSSLNIQTTVLGC